MVNLMSKATSVLGVGAKAYKFIKKNKYLMMSFLVLIFAYYFVL